MGETPDQIERHIYEKRSELGENIHELQQKVKTAVDWRAQFDQRPWVLMGAAFGGGLLLALLFGGRGDSSRSSSPDAWKREGYRTGNAQQRDDKTNAIWENIRGAALAVGGQQIGERAGRRPAGFPGAIQEKAARAAELLHIAAQRSRNTDAQDRQR